MRIGYACLTKGVPNTSLRAVRRKNASVSRLVEITAHNLSALERIIEYNASAGIGLFRLSSDIIPFGSSPMNGFEWRAHFTARLEDIGGRIKAANMRVSMHPGQYTVLNSAQKEIVRHAVSDLEYHCAFLDSLGAGPESKIVLHVGGVYGDRSASIGRFMRNYELLGDHVKKRLVLENDERGYSPGEVLAIGRQLEMPVVYDNLHCRINPGAGSGALKPGSDADALKADYEWISRCAATWGIADGPQKIHYSQQDPGKRPGAHSPTIGITDFVDFYNGLGPRELDVMLEVKDKNLSAVKCINTVAGSHRIEILEKEWSRYKYRVLEGSPRIYQQIRDLLKDKHAYPAQKFYESVENALQADANRAHAVNAVQHVWGYLSGLATEAEQGAFTVRLEAYRQGSLNLAALKKYLLKLSRKYRQDYLLDSYYFIL